DREQFQYYNFSKDGDGFKALSVIVPKDHYVRREASGHYYLRLGCFLTSMNIRVSVINPLVIRRFCQMRMSRAKTDKKDARMIAEYGKAENPSLWQAPPRHVIALQQMEALLFMLNKEHTALNNQLQ